MRLSVVKSFPPKILKEESKFCISIYLPTNTENRNQDIRNFKELIDVLEASGSFKEQVIYLRSLQNDLEFWKSNLNSLAILLNQEHVAINKLMLVVDEQIHISDHFYVLPLIENYQKNHRYFLLTLEENSFKLYFGNLYGVFELDIIDKISTNQELSIENYYRLIDQFIDDNFTTVYRSPLLISASPNLYETFHNISQNPMLLSIHMDSTSIDATTKDIHTKSWHVMESLQNEKIDQLNTDYHNLNKHDYIFCDIQDIIPAIRNFEIDYLILNRQKKLNGFIGFDGHNFEINEHGDSLINHLAEFALKYDTEVILLNTDQMPSDDDYIAVRKSK
ncbi:hypothetical protein ERUR111494_02390 [Erysipelothrix urinaevulpis]|uniref:baeRF6 domain-containing protein n=1 Tax=Erysipelothrix urinaevulpis TaxID=2683717 RepID=UPI0013572639|nr:hypothetical protein [Erysipelothrix urinaevulpis]